MSRQPHQGNHLPSIRADMEKAMGIIFYSSPADTGLQGEMRKRFTDFLVNELRKDGAAIYLKDYEIPTASSKGQTRSTGPNKTFTKDPSSRSGASSAFAPVSENMIETTQRDRIVLEDLIGKDATDKVIELDMAIQKGDQRQTSWVQFPAGLDRDQRTNTHQQIRRIFSSRVSTETDSAGIITAKPMSRSKYHSGTSQHFKWQNQGEQSNRKGFAALGGEYLHFTLFKVNKDTMDAINNIARALKIKATAFGFAGTKDRRAATVQRLSIRYQRAENLIWLNDKNSGFKVGDFEHHTYPITLGQHGGNQFVITLKNCFVARGVGCSLPRQVELVEQAVEVALAQIVKHGFINYFGLQRFGTHTIGTHEVGIKILQEDFEGAIDALLHAENDPGSKPVGRTASDQVAHTDEVARYRAITLFKVDHNAEKALQIMPRRFTAEWNIIRHLSQPNCKRDYVNALLTITRGMRMMYIHAYQSYVWNHAASHRWSNFGSKVIEGDLVLESINDTKGAAPSGADERDEDQNDEHYNAKAHVVTAEDVASGRYTIFDIVLPTPGFDVWYPANDVGKFYKDFMGRTENGGLDPYAMRRKNKEFSLSGSYRYLIGRFIEAPAFSVRTYTDDVEQMYPTDDDIIQQRRREREMLRAKTFQSQPPQPTRPVRNLETDLTNKVAGWNNWAVNSQKHDIDELNEHKRVMAAIPKPDGTTIQDTWVQTGLLDGRRAKVGKDIREIYHQNDQGDPSRTTDDAKSAHAAEGKSSRPFEGGDSEYGPSVSGQAKMQFTENAKTAWDEPAVKAMPLKEKGVVTQSSSHPLVQGVKRTAAEAGLSSGTRTEATMGALPDNRQLSCPVSLIDVSTPTSASAPRPDGPLNGSNVPSMADLLSDGPIPQESRPIQRAAHTAPSPPTQMEKSPTPTPLAMELPGSANGVTFPEFHVVGANTTTTTSFAEGVTREDKANKIAVILKFKLRSSNYATIALREVMGTVVESRPGPRPGSS